MCARGQFDYYARMADEITVTFFHLTFDENLKGIKESGGLIPGGNQHGMSALQVNNLSKKQDVR